MFLWKSSRETQLKFEFNIWLQPYTFYLKSSRWCISVDWKWICEYTIKSKIYLFIYLFSNLEIRSQIPLSGQKTQLCIFHCSHFWLQNHVPIPTFRLDSFHLQCSTAKDPPIMNSPAGTTMCCHQWEFPHLRGQNNLWLLLPPLWHTIQPTHAPSWSFVTCSHSSWLSHFTAWPCSSQQHAHSRGAPCNGIRSALCRIFSFAPAELAGCVLF